MCREHLGRALALGFREFRVASPERPVVARGGDRLYLVAALDPSTAVGADPPTETTTPSRRISMPSRDTPPVDRNGHSEPPPPGDPIDPLAEALRSVLTEAASRAARLVGALRQFRKEKRVLANAWSSLRQLNLGP